MKERPPFSDLCAACGMPLNGSSAVMVVIRNRTDAPYPICQPCEETAAASQAGFYDIQDAIFNRQER